MKIQTKRLDIRTLSVALWKDFYLCRDQFEMSLGLDPSVPLMSEEYLREYRELLPDLLRFAQRDPDNLIWYTQWVCIDREKHLLTCAFNFLGPPSKDGGVLLAFFGADAYPEDKYMEEALQGTLSWLMTQNDVRYVCCETTRKDLAEMHLLERIGFERGRQGEATIIWTYSPKRGIRSRERKLTF